MSLFTDIRDAVESPFKGLANLIISPITVTKDVISGKNVLDTLHSEWKDSIAPLLPAAPMLKFATSDSGKGILDSSIANKLTFGMSSNVERTAGFATNVENIEPEKITKDQTLGTLRTGAVVGAAVAAVALVPGAAGAATGANYAGAQLVNNALSKGDLSSAIDAASGMVGVDLPPELTDALPDGSHPATVPGTRTPAGGTRVSDPYSTPAGGLSVTNNSSLSPYILPAVIGIGLILLLKGRK